MIGHIGLVKWVNRLGRSRINSLSVGIDLGGTKVEAALVDSNGQILSSNRYPTSPKKGPNGIIEDLISAVNTFKKEGEIKSVGIGVAGQVSSEGIIRSAPNLPFQNEPLQAKLKKELGLSVVVTNDVRAATFGEWQHGSGKGVDDMVVIFVGTGIGGGVVSGGQILEGCYNTGGELGHTMLVSGGRKCRCPNRGCLEAYSGGWAIAERAKEAVSENPAEGKTLKTLGGGTKNITAATVSQAYVEGDILAKRLVEETGKYLASGVVGIVNAFSPCILVFGGGVIEGLPVLINAVEKTVRKRALAPCSEKLRIVKGELGVKAGVIGASEMARNRFGGKGA